ncbi:MAG TPA: hypothetical protein VJV78_36435 [Polyangiales bacterium]|nr:hypothetical protein [Polyangiales bacterium]
MSTTTTKQSKTWVIATAALVACVGILAWILARPTDDALPEDTTASEPTPPEPVPAPTPQPKTAATTTAAVAAKPVEAAKPVPQPAAAEDEVDLFADAMPDFMVNIHAQVLDKKPLNVEQQKALYKWGQENKDDARPQLLLAWDCVNREWEGMAISMYRIAFKADPRARDQKNLRDLLNLASKHEPGRVEFDEAEQTVQDNFGGSALAEIETQLAKLNAAGELQRAARLSKMRDDLGKL